MTFKQHSREFSLKIRFVLIEFLKILSLRNRYDGPEYHHRGPNKIAWQTYLMHQSFNQNSINIYFTTDCKTYRMDLHPHDWPVPCRRRPMQWSSPKNASKPGNTWSPQPMQATTGAGYRPMVRTDDIDYSRTKIPWSCHSVSKWLLYNLRWAKSIMVYWMI